MNRVVTTLRQLGRWIVRGLIAVLPLAITIYILYWLASVLQAPMVPVVSRIPVVRSIPGMGLLLALAMLVVIGLLTRFYVAQRMLRWSDRFFERIPVAKTIYGSVKDIMSVVSGGSKGTFSEVVLVKMPNSEMRLLGTVTRRGFEEFSGPARNMVGVYLPMSYQIGGYIVMVPEDCVEKVEMTAEQALKFAMTAGLSNTASAESAPKTPLDIAEAAVPSTPGKRTGGA